ncbi:hypothetical protein DQP58_04865 [Mycobacterium colombiense]|uniref:Predicted hydrolase N-terminal domain-containing protein n=1 Tax=Mycobacterium colombiense TaxID=339268 RepID=A0A329KSD4_9MYCO|nr:hypothetical protein [Mycobacterium colombiense]RAU98784.1 hypothetical protein DQP58_04865 [Mycobacterium colombiense]
MTWANFAEAELSAAAGGDPWAINQSLQAGNPYQIDRLAEAFHNAGRCTAAASEEFAQARKRFEAAWNREGGAHPINESEEVQQVTKSLGYQSEQLPKIGLDLENVATALAAAQRAGADEIAALDRQLHVLDVLISAAKKDLTYPLPATERDKLEKLINDAHADAVDDVRDALKQMLMIRGLYTDVLDASRGILARDGYDPSLIWGVDGHQPQKPAPHGAGPSIDGPATPPKMEGQNTWRQDDLDSSIPGTGIALGGDGADGYPNIHLPPHGDFPGYDGDNPLRYPPDNPLPIPNDVMRPLPTGTAVGPNGERYGFYAMVPYHNANGGKNENYTVPDTVVVNLDHPDQVLYTLHGISQASGAYDAKSGRMVILGNTPDGQRAIWQSAPVGQNPAWGNSLQQQGTFSGAMNGNRESQIVALPKGGLMVVGASESPAHQTLPIQAVTASTPQGLLTAKPTALVDPKSLPGVYGPTITGIQEINGKEVISMRVSTFGEGRYDPHTYTTTFSVTP